MRIATLGVTVFFLCSNVSGKIWYGDGVGSPDGRYTAVYLGSAVRIEENPAGDNPVRVGVLPVYTLNWTGDSHTIVATEHQAGGSYCTLIYLAEGRWKRLEVEPIDDYEAAAVVDLTIRNHSITVTYKLRWRDDADYQFRLCSFDVDTITRNRSKEKLEKITAAKYSKLWNWPTEASIRLAYPRHND